jgi:hypothetical protein
MATFGCGSATLGHTAADVRNCLVPERTESAEVLLRRVACPDDSDPRQIVIEPELVVRKSTAAVSTD